MGAAIHDRPGRAEPATLEAVAPLLELVTSSAPLAVQLKALVLFVERLAGDMRCSVLIADTQAGRLYHGAAPNLPAAYCAAIDGISYGEGVGSCGTAAARHAVVIVSDIQHSPLWRDYRELAGAHSLAACWSVPLLSTAGELLGTFAMYYSDPRDPTAAELELLRIVGPLGTLIIERHRDAARLRASELRYRKLTETSPDSILAHCDGRITYANPAAARLFGGARAEDIAGRMLADLCGAQTAADLLAHRSGMQACRFRRQDGVTLAIEVTAAELTVDAQSMSVLICRDVTERKTLENDLVDAASREQENLGYDLHDGIGQQLTGIAMLLGAVATDLRRDHGSVAVELDGIRGLVTQTIEDTRRLALGMAPVTVERAGLGGALLTLARDSRMLYGLTVAVRIRAAGAAEPAPARATHLYRIAQEAVRNAARHAKARRVLIRLDVVGNELSLRITDDGIGLRQSVEESAGLGLRSMRYRAERLGGRVWFEARRPVGTRIRVECPLVPAAV